MKVLRNSVEANLAEYKESHKNEKEFFLQMRNIKQKL